MEEREKTDFARQGVSANKINFSKLRSITCQSKYFQSAQYYELHN